MRKILLGIVIFFMMLNPVLAATNEGYGEDSEALGQYVDSFEDMTGISVNVSVIRNTTLNGMESGIGVTANIAYEDFSTFTEFEEAGDRITYPANNTHLSYDLIRNLDTRTYKDFGADYFGPFSEYLVDMRWAGGANGGKMWFMLSNHTNNAASHQPNSWGYLAIVQTQYGGNNVFEPIEGKLDGTQNFVTGAAKAENTWYYLNFTLTATDFITRVYTNAARTALSETLTVTLDEPMRVYRYLIISSLDSNDAISQQGNVKNVWVGDYETGYVAEGYFSTIDYLSDPLANGSTLALMTNTSILDNSGITVQFSPDNSTWVDNTGATGASTLTDGFQTLDMRNLNYSSSAYLMFNFTSAGENTSVLLQSRLITTEGNESLGSVTNVLNGTWIDYNLSAIGVTVGTLDSGFLNSTYFIDGNIYNVSEVAGAPGMQITANATGIDDEAISLWITIYGQYDGNLAHDFDIEVWNFTSSAWVEDDHIPDQAAFDWTNSTIYGLRVPIDFMDSGEVRIRLDHESAGNINHDLFIEYFRIQAFVPTGLAVGAPGGGGSGAIGFIMLGLILIPAIFFLGVRKR
jgi:hypothetical protein